jgi:hypothetical protein
VYIYRHTTMLFSTLGVKQLFGTRPLPHVLSPMVAPCPRVTSLRLHVWWCAPCPMVAPCSPLLTPKNKNEKRSDARACARAPHIKDAMLNQQPPRVLLLQCLGPKVFGTTLCLINTYWQILNHHQMQKNNRVWSCGFSHSECGERKHFQMPRKLIITEPPSKCGTFSFPFPNHVLFFPLKFKYLQKKLQKRGNGDGLDTIISFHFISFISKTFAWHQGLAPASKN